MSEISERYRTIASGFSARVDAVPAGAWDNPAPCEGWVARDVIRHLVEWVPPVLADGAAIELPGGPSVDDDPAGAWHALDRGLQSIIDDPEQANREFDHPQAGQMSVEVAMNMIVVNDVFLHTWDLARATGLDETLDPEIAAEMLAGMEPYDEMLRSSGQYGPRVDVPDDADVQTRLLAFIGRRP